jgi:glutamine amidotransferase
MSESRNMAELIGILDYGVGNLHSLSNAMKGLGSQIQIIDSAQDFSKFSKLILPGVGAFPYAMEQIKINDYEISIHEFIRSGKPILGICLGMQILARKSFEIKETTGLGIFDADVHSLSDLVSKNLKPTIPNMGWQKVSIKKHTSLLMKSSTDSDFFYFAHSFGLKEAPEVSKNITSYFTFFGTPLISSIEIDNVFGLQFHPEKSGENGLSILRNFVNIK